MNVKQLGRFCRQLPFANERLLAPPANILVYSVDEKFFAYFKTSTPERWRFSTRVSRDRFIELTDFPGVKPARYRGRFQWITIVEVQRFPASYLTELVECSYNRAFASLSKARQMAIRASGA
jgi:predicted DNA-binding protein (MmcQ/YjbR family)